MLITSRVTVAIIVIYNGRAQGTYSSNRAPYSPAQVAQVAQVARSSFNLSARDDFLSPGVKLYSI